MYLFWHLFFAAILASLLTLLLKPNPSKPFFLTMAFVGVLPDLDHLLYWTPDSLSRIIPTYLWEGLTFSLRRSVYPMVLHLWLWPILLFAAAILLRRNKLHPYIFAGVAGWTVHLAFDGVLTVI